MFPSTITLGRDRVTARVSSWPLAPACGAGSACDACLRDDRLRMPLPLPLRLPLADGTRMPGFEPVEWP